MRTWARSSSSASELGRVRNSMRPSRPSSFALKLERAHVRMPLRTIRNGMRPSSSSHTELVLTRTCPWMLARAHRARSSSGAFEYASSLVRARAMRPSSNAPADMSSNAGPKPRDFIFAPPKRIGANSSARGRGRVRTTLSYPFAASPARGRCRVRTTISYPCAALSARGRGRVQTTISHPYTAHNRLREDEAAYAAQSSIRTCWIPAHSVGRADAAGDGGIVRREQRIERPLFCERRSIAIQN